MRMVRVFSLAILLAAVAAAPAAVAREQEGADLLYGFTEDAPKYADDGGSSMYPLMLAFGPLLRWDVEIDADGTIRDLPFLRRAYPKAIAAGMKLIFLVHSTRAADHDPAVFCPRVADLVREFPDLWGVAVWKEPNTEREWVPQKDEAGNILSAPAYWELLVACSRLIRAADPDVYIIAGTTSPRASTPRSTAPIPFIRRLIEHARSTGIPGRVFDIWGQNVYPNPSRPTDGPEVGYPDTNNVGIPNLDRLASALYGFNGTPQPSTVGCTAANPFPRGCIKILVSEWGWQVDTSGLPGYLGTENVPVVSEQAQAEFVYRALTQYLNCNRDVIGALHFHFVDERYRDASGGGGGWNNGLQDVNGRLRPVYERAIQAKADGCRGQLGAFDPTQGVRGDAAFVEQKEQLQRTIKQLRLRVRAALKAVKIPRSLARKYLATLSRLERSLGLARLPQQLKPIARTLERMDGALDRAERRRGRARR